MMPSVSRGPGVARARHLQAGGGDYVDYSPTRKRRAPQPVPADLQVQCRIVCQRWQGVCQGNYACSYQTKLGAAYAAARAALEGYLQRGVALRDIELTADPINADTYHVRFLGARRAA